MWPINKNDCQKENVDEYFINWKLFCFCSNCQRSAGFNKGMNGRISTHRLFVCAWRPTNSAFPTVTAGYIIPPHADAPTVGRVIFSQWEHTRNCVSATFGKVPATNHLETSQHVTQRLPSRTSTAIMLAWPPLRPPKLTPLILVSPTESSFWNEKEKESPPR